MIQLSFDPTAFRAAAQYVIDIADAPALTGGSRRCLDTEDLSALRGHFAEALNEASIHDLIVHTVTGLPDSATDPDIMISSDTDFADDGFPEGTHCELDVTFRSGGHRQRISVAAHLDVIDVDRLCRDVPEPSLLDQLVGLAAEYTARLNDHLQRAQEAWTAVLVA
ncbi:hypothetical protein [Gordonia sihwensis]|uniref:hypothetical protein n=1 Tax=Gordonia sihwensis TaxID=173559 RepID=UPI0005EE0AFD|nr:hypothetical protein [Gordonia sihwensis]KJR10564.1 hypothetical protein UG54_00830 [Gordonia sihwensis]